MPPSVPPAFCKNIDQAVSRELPCLSQIEEDRAGMCLYDPSDSDAARSFTHDPTSFRQTSSPECRGFAWQELTYYIPCSLFLRGSALDRDARERPLQCREDDASSSLDEPLCTIDSDRPLLNSLANGSGGWMRSALKYIDRTPDPAPLEEPTQERSSRRYGTEPAFVVQGS